MNINCLQAFYMSVKFGSISKAAKCLHFTEPGLSAQIKSLENELGIKLLKRNNKGVTLTEEGKVAYEYACTFVSMADRLMVALKNSQNKKSSVHICVCDNIEENMLLCGIYKFKEAYPDINITVEIYNAQIVLKKLLDYDTNIGIIADTKIPQNVLFTPIMKDRLILVGKNGGEKDTINLDELTALPLILKEKGSGILFELENALSMKNLTLDNLNILILLNSTELIKSSVVSGKGYSFLPESIVSRELELAVLKKITIKDFSVSLGYYAVFRENYFLTDAEKNLISFLSFTKTVP